MVMKSGCARPYLQLQSYIVVILGILWHNKKNNAKIYLNINALLNNYCEFIVELL